MGINFEINGKKITPDNLGKINQQSSEDLEDQVDLVKSLSALKRIKEMKGEKLSPFLENQLKSALDNVGKEGLKNINQDNETIDLNESLDKLEQIKSVKRIKQTENQEGEKTKACQKCGRETILSSKFCPSCGNKFENRQEETAEIVSESSKAETSVEIPVAEGEKDLQPKKQEAEAPVEIPITEKEKNLWSESDLEIAATNEKNLLNFLDKVDGIQGSGKYYTREELKSGVKDSLEKLRKVDMKDKDAVNNILKYVTNQGDIKLREKVYQIALKEKIQGM